jgi:hypothetical protein
MRGRAPCGFGRSPWNSRKLGLIRNADAPCPATAHDIAWPGLTALILDVLWGFDEPEESAKKKTQHSAAPVFG